MFCETLGKSHLACRLGVKEVKNGIVLDVPLHAIRAARLKAQRDPNTALLINDEGVLRSLDCMQENLFLRLASPRYDDESDGVWSTLFSHVLLANLDEWDYILRG